MSLLLTKYGCLLLNNVQKVVNIRFFKQLSYGSSKLIRRLHPNEGSQSSCGILKTFSTAVPLSVKRIKETTEGLVTTVEGVYEENSAADPAITEDSESGACPLCRLGLPIKYTDVLILNQFLEHDGSVLPRHVTGLCVQKHARLLETVRKAHRAGLLDNRKPPTFKQDASSRYRWKKYNVWYNEHKLHLPYYPRNCC